MSAVNLESSRGAVNVLETPRVCYGVVWQWIMQSIPNDEAERNRTGSSQS